MKITRQLRLDALAADGTAPIHLTITWEGNHLRLGTLGSKPARTVSPRRGLSRYLKRTSPKLGASPFAWIYQAITH
jgi:hypothetical protein